MVDLARIEERIDREAMSGVAVDAEIGGVQFRSVVEVMEFAKLMAISGAAVPRHLRANPGLCLAVTVQALEWRMSPFSVAAKSYVATQAGDERLAYESQLVHAVIEARAPLKGRLRYEITGEGDERRCRVWGTFKGETEPHEYTSETLATLREGRGRNDRGAVKGSPLWDKQPEVQLFYSASRQWCRIYAPDVLLGIYTPDELGGEVKDVSPAPKEEKPLSALAQRLAANKTPQNGFDHRRVQREAAEATPAGATIEGEASEVAAADEAAADSEEDETKGGAATKAKRKTATQQT